MTRNRRPRGRLTECRDCASPITFATLDTGSRIPLNPLPNAAGNVAVRLVGGALHGYVIADAKPYRPDHDRMMPHAATCRSRPARIPEQRTPSDVETDDPLF